jgi:quercetin dioxygenase-like cupin family protein
MPAAEDRLRQHPAQRFAGEEHHIDLGAALAALRGERHPAVDGHRQITVSHHGPVRLVLFAFEAGGRIPEHRAAGFVTIHVLRGALRVRTPQRSYELGAGSLLALDPGVPHDVEAPVETDMLLGVHPEGRGARAR